MSVLSAVVFPVLIGIVALVADFGYALVIKAENQRVADLAAYAGALAYNATTSTTTMNAVVANVVTLNGVASANATASLVTSPTGDGNQAVLVSIATTDPLQLARVLSTTTQLTIGAQAYAELKANTSGCVIALSTSGTGVTLSGGTALTTNNCAVASNATVSAPCGTTITTIAVDYNSSTVPSQPCGGIKPPSGTSAVKILKAITADPLAGASGVTAATARITTVAAEASPSAPTVTTGGDISFAWSASATQAQAVADGCTATFSSPTWTLTCPSGGTYKFGNITIGGGITVNFNTSGTAATTYNFSGSIYNTGSAMTFGPGTYNIAGGVMTGGGTTTTFGAGTFNIGRGGGACSGAGKYSICNTGTKLVFGGPSTFKLQGGIYNAGGSILTLGSGTTNSFLIGSSSDGNAFYAGGGSNTIFADATGSSSLFQLIGNFNVASGGGSCVSVSAAAQHDINGYFSTAGGTTLGAGVYTVNGYVALGANGGGDVTCNGVSVGMAGTGVTFVISAVTKPSSGTCSGQAFCLAAGYSNVTLTAPSSGTTAQLLVVGPISSANTAGATFAEGASNTSLSGTFYFPNGPVTLSGGASVGNGAGQCLELVGSQITLTGGTTLASNCIASTSSSSTVKLVQ
ncbi:MAG: pilus assembly protein TadG-related protein [Caulobacteraceae bacterium]|nr:pilus assembly protein TadG-related protein [Caulobacteraceae bacterium]